MVRNKSIYLALLWLIVLPKASTENKLGNKACIQRERDALLAFRAGLVDPMNWLSSWKGHDCCQWRGVACSNTAAHVVRLDLRNTDDWSYALSGEVSSSILSLQHLNYLDLSFNSFNGTKIPEFIGSLAELTYLSLAETKFSGKIPPQFGNLSRLQYLEISLMENIYMDDISWLTYLSSLKCLDMSFVNLSTVISWERFGMLPQLQTLYLHGCGLEDITFTLSHVNFTELVTLDLGFNKLSSHLSINWIRNLTKLQSINFESNNFDSSLLNAVGSINSIESLYLRSNNLVNMKLSDLKNLSNLEYLDLEDNNISGDITKLVDGFLPHKLQYLNLELNNLNGNISNWIGRMTSLLVRRLASNKLSGPIPLSIRELTQLISLGISDNSFYGTITEQHLYTMTNLNELWFSGNHLNIIMDTNWMPPFRLSFADLSSCNLGFKFPKWLKSQTVSFVSRIISVSISIEMEI